MRWVHSNLLVNRFRVAFDNRWNLAAMMQLSARS